MSKEELEKVCEYIRTHELLGTEIETIFAAIKAVTGRDTAIFTTATAKDYQSEEDKAETMDKSGYAQKMEITDLIRIFRAVEQKKQGENFLAENEKLADMKLPELKPIIDKYADVNKANNQAGTPAIEPLDLSALNSIPKDDIVMPSPVVEHEFLHMPMATEPDPINLPHEIFHYGQGLPSTTTEPIITDETIDDLVSKVTSMRKPDTMPNKTGPVIINDYAADRLSNTNKVDKNSELESMIENVEKHPKLTDDFGHPIHH